MKLSAVPLFGHTHVRATRLVKVLHPHDVSTRGAAVDALQDAEAVEGAAPIARTAPQAGKDVVKAKVGDLAIELEEVSTRTVIGYSYLTGEAITCVSYDLGAHRYEDALIKRLTEIEACLAQFRAQGETKEIDESTAVSFITRIIALCQEARWSELDVAVLEFVAGDSYKEVAQRLMEAWAHYEPNDLTGLPAKQDRTCHLIGTVWRRPPKMPGRLSFRKKMEHHCTIHLQPPKHANDHAATPFQHRLLVDLSTRIAAPATSAVPSGDSPRDESRTSG